MPLSITASKAASPCARSLVTSPTSHDTLGGSAACFSRMYSTTTALMSTFAMRPVWPSATISATHGLNRAGQGAQLSRPTDAR